MQGTVKWFSSEKGYGFITSSSGEDHYFNVQGIQGADLPFVGDLVEFESQNGQKGLKAVNVVITSRAPNGQRKDDRIVCSGCDRMIVPRIITDRGSLDHSVCPFCGTWIKDYSILRYLIGWILKLAAANPIPTAILALVILIYVNA